MSHDSSSTRRGATTTRYGRPIFYDREIFIRICSRRVDREDLRAICNEPGMPREGVFLGWMEDHREAREIYQSSQNVAVHRMLSKELGLAGTPTDGREWEQEVRANIERGWPADCIERKYIPPDWSKVYPLVGDPPVWSTENMQAYDDLINSFTQMLQPRDLMELIWVKEAGDATWEAGRNAREKNALPERKFRQQFIEVGQSGAAEATAAKAATALDHSRGLAGDYRYYQGLDIAHTRAIKRRDHALRQIERWRDGLGGKARALSDRFISEQMLAERYGADQVAADAEIGAPAGEPIEADPVAPPHDAAEAAPLIRSVGRDCISSARTRFHRRHRGSRTPTRSCGQNGGSCICRRARASCAAACVHARYRTRITATRSHRPHCGVRAPSCGRYRGSGGRKVQRDSK
jgi:hypothetical protein